MTIDEVSKNYHIPLEILKLYESWGLCQSVKKVIGNWHYDDSDIERLSVIMTLHDIGFSSSEIEIYMRLLLAHHHTETERIAMITQKRKQALDEIHFKEKQIEYMDYLRHEINEERSKTCNTQN